MDSGVTGGRRVGKWIGAIASLVLLAGLALAIRQWVPRPTAQPAVSGVPADTSNPIPRALSQAGGVDEKSRWIDDLPEVEMASLDAERREIFLRQVNTRRCTCGCGYTLAACRIYDSSCDKSLPRVRAVFDSVARGLLADVTGLRAPPGAESR